MTARPPASTWTSAAGASAAGPVHATRSPSRTTAASVTMPRRSLGLRVVGDQLADVGDDGAHGQSLPIVSSRSRPMSCSSPRVKTTWPSATTWTTSAAVAAKTAVCSSRPVPAVRGVVVSRVTRSARAPTAIASRVVVPEAGVAVDRGGAEELAGRPVPALAGGEALVELDGPHLLEQVDDGVAVGAEGQRAARVVQAPARADAVAEVALGGGAEAGEGTGGAEVADVVVGQVGRVHGAGQRAEHAVVGEQLGGGGAVRRDAGVVLRGLLRQVDVERLARGGLHDRAELVVGDGADGVDGGAGVLEACDPFGPGVGGAVAEPLAGRHSEARRSRC